MIKTCFSSHVYLVYFYFLYVYTQFSFIFSSEFKLVPRKSIHFIYKRKMN